MTPRRVQLTGGLYNRVVPAGAVDITRPSRWQNPFPVADYGRAQALRLYRGWLAGHPDTVALARSRGVRLHLYGQALVDAARQQLAGRNLACWCKPDEECHGDILLAVIAETDPLRATHSAEQDPPRGTASTGGTETGGLPA